MPRHPENRHRARAPVHTATRLRERRHRLAHEAARLIAESGLPDYPQAKAKAARRLGILDAASLPRDEEVEAALREYQRLFRPDAAGELRRRREAALQAMEFFDAWHPRLVGPVLEGTADRHSPVILHLHADDADEVGRRFAQLGIPAEAGSRRLRLDRTRGAEFPSWHFDADGLPFELTVLPMAQLRHAPVAGPDARPLARASATQLRELLASSTPA